MRCAVPAPRKPGATIHSFDLQSVAGVKQVELIGAGVVARTESLHAAPHQVHVDFPLSTQSRTWYSLTVEHNQGDKAYTDPIWVDAVEPWIGSTNVGGR